MTHPGRYIPVNAPDIVTRLILANLLESDSGAFEYTVVFAAQKILHGPAGSELQESDLSQYVARQHG